MKRGFLYTISAFAISVVFLTSLSFLYTDRLRNYIDSRNAIDSSQRLIIQLYRMSYYVREIERDHRSFLLSRDRAFLKEYDSALTELKNTRDSLYVLIPANQPLRPRLSQLNLTLLDRLRQLQGILHASASDSLDVVQTILRSHPVRTELIGFIQ